MEAEIRQRDDRQAWDALQQVEHAGEMLIDELLGLSEDIVSQKNLVAFSTGEKGKESLGRRTPPGEDGIQHAYQQRVSPGPPTRTSV